MKRFSIKTICHYSFRTPLSHMSVLRSGPCDLFRPSNRRYCYSVTCRPGEMTSGLLATLFPLLVEEYLFPSLLGQLLVLPWRVSMAVGTIRGYYVVRYSLLGSQQQIPDVEKGALVPGEISCQTLLSGGCFESLVFNCTRYYLISPHPQYHPSTVPYPLQFFAPSTPQSR